MRGGGPEGGGGGARPDRRRRHRGRHGPHRGDGRFARADRPHPLFADALEELAPRASRRCRICRLRHHLGGGGRRRDGGGASASRRSTPASACAPRCWDRASAGRGRAEPAPRPGRRAAGAGRCRRFIRPAPRASCWNGRGPAARCCCARSRGRAQRRWASGCATGHVSGGRHHGERHRRVGAGADARHRSAQTERATWRSRTAIPASCVISLSSWDI